MFSSLTEGGSVFFINGIKEAVNSVSVLLIDERRLNVRNYGINWFQAE